MNTTTPMGMLQQPRPFFMIFFVELWERFGYYGVQGVLAVFFVKQLGFSQEQAFVTFGAFAALVYGLISIGGYVGDHLLGTIAVGNGLFKANPASLLSKCYPPKDPRLDGAVAETNDCDGTISAMPQPAFWLKPYFTGLLHHHLSHKLFSQLHTVRFTKELYFRFWALYIWLNLFIHRRGTKRMTECFLRICLNQPVQKHS